MGDWETSGIKLLVSEVCKSLSLKSLSLLV